MHLRAFALPLAICAALAPLSAHASEDGDRKKPGIFSRTLDTLNPFNDGAKKQTKASDAKLPGGRQLALTLVIEPAPLRLSESRQMTVRLQLTNKSRRLVQLEFPTTQRFEVLVRNRAGRMVEQWSEDQRFEPEAGLVTINPGERLEYAATVSTRDLAAGESYTVEGYFPNYEALRAQQPIVPGK